MTHQKSLMTHLGHDSGFGTPVTKGKQSSFHILFLNNWTGDSQHTYTHCSGNKFNTPFLLHFTGGFVSLSALCDEDFHLSPTLYVHSYA